MLILSLFIKSRKDCYEGLRDVAMLFPESFGMPGVGLARRAGPAVSSRGNILKQVERSFASRSFERVLSLDATEPARRASPTLTDIEPAGSTVLRKRRGR